jgi:hypothetical protein
LFVQVTVVPTATTNGFVPKAVVVRVRAPLGIDTAADPPVGVDEGVELGDDELLHAAAAVARTATIRILRNAIRLLNGSISATVALRKQIADSCV